MIPTSEDRLFKRVSEMIDDMLEERLVGICEVDMPARTLRRVREGSRNVTVRTLLRVCNALGYDLVLNARKKK